MEPSQAVDSKGLIRCYISLYLIENKGLIWLHHGYIAMLLKTKDCIVAINVQVGRIVPVLRGSMVLVRGRLAIGLPIVPMIYLRQSHLNIPLSDVRLATMINLFKTRLSESPLTQKRRCTTLSSTPVTKSKSKSSVS